LYKAQIKVTLRKSILDPQGKVLAGPVGTEYSKEKYLKFLQEGLNKHQQK
jgi:phosphoribosylformylglycinamidine (FGAM) synthase PurS component